MKNIPDKPNLSDEDKKKIEAIKRKYALEQKKPALSDEKKDLSKETDEIQNNSKLAKCTTCGKVVSKTAKTCPHCGEKDPAPIQSQTTGCFTVVVIIVLSVWVLVMFFGNSGGSGTSTTPKYDEFGAKLNCQNFIKKRLKAPSTADFAPHRDLKISGSDLEWTVIGFVDAQNSFGAKIRQTYICKIHYQGNTVYLDNLIMK